MFLEISALLILVITVVSPFVLAWYITVKINESAHRDRVIHDRVLTRIEGLAKETVKVSGSTAIAQEALDRKFNALSRLVDELNTRVTWEYQQFNALAKSDVMAARREELLRSKELRVALERLMGIAFTSKQPAAPNDVIALNNLDSRIMELETILRVEGDSVTIKN